jgi:hypothetical protein
VARSSNRVEIPGLDQLRADLKGMPRDIKRILPEEFKRVADQVVDDARQRVPVVTGRAAAGIVAKGYATGPAIVEKRDPPYLRVLDFGSGTAVSGNPRSVGPWHGSGVGPKGGRFVYPALKRNGAEIRRAAEQAVERAAERAGFK